MSLSFFIAPTARGLTWRHTLPPWRSLMEEGRLRVAVNLLSAEEVVESAVRSAGEEEAEAKLRPSPPPHQSRCFKLGEEDCCCDCMPHRYATYMAACGRPLRALLRARLRSEGSGQGSADNEKLTQADIDATDAVIFAVCLWSSVERIFASRVSHYPDLLKPKRAVRVKPKMIGGSSRLRTPTVARVAAASAVRTARRYRRRLGLALWLPAGRYST